MAKFKPLIFLSVTVLFGIFIFVTLVNKPDPTTPPPSPSVSLALEKRIAIIDHSKLEITPVWNKSRLELHIDLESFENNDLLALNMKDYSLVKINSTLEDTVEWHITEEKNNTIQGTLIVTPTHLPESLSNASIECIFYFKDRLSIKW